MKTDLTYEDVRDRLRAIVEAIYETVPAGVGARGDIVLGKKVSGRSSSRVQNGL